MAACSTCTTTLNNTAFTAVLSQPWSWLDSPAIPSLSISTDVVTYLLTYVQFTSFLYLLRQTVSYNVVPMISMTPRLFVCKFAYYSLCCGPLPIKAALGIASIPSVRESVRYSDFFANSRPIFSSSYKSVHNFKYAYIVGSCHYCYTPIARSTSSEYALLLQIQIHV